MTSISPSGDLADYVADWSPSPLETHDDISWQRAQKFSATLDCGDAIADGDALPALRDPTAALPAKHRMKNSDRRHKPRPGCNPSTSAAQSRKFGTHRNT